MIFSANPETLTLAPVVGGYLCLSASGLLRRDAAGAFLSDLAAHRGAMHAVGAIAFLAGAAIVALHRHWSTPAEIALSATGTWWAFEGAGLLASPGLLARLFVRPGAARGFAIGQALGGGIGVYLLAVAMVGRPA